MLLDRMSRSAERHNRVIVLFTDGENNTGRDPVETLKESNEANIRVHFIGVDLEREIRGKPQVQRLLQSVIGYATAAEVSIVAQKCHSGFAGSRTAELVQWKTMKWRNGLGTRDTCGSVAAAVWKCLKRLAFCRFCASQ